MNFVEYQGQHRISQIYLKQFGYQKDDEWYISVWHKSDNHTDNLQVKNFTKETNVFDLPYEDIELRRHFENISSKELESRYEMVIKSIHNQKNLNTRNKSILFHFVANLICRALPHRDFLNTLLLNADTREIFLEEITTFEEKSLPVLKEALSTLKSEYQLNMVLGQIMNYLAQVFKTFNCVILKDHENKGWFTSDNPINIDKQGNFSYIIPPEAEIYFPLSKDYYLFIFNEESEIKTNPLRKLRKNKINEIDEATHKMLCDKVTWNENRYLIFPTEIENTLFTKD